MNIDNINPWDYINDDLPLGIRVSIASVMFNLKFSSKKTDDNYAKYEKAFYIIVDYWINKKKYADVKDDKIILTRDGEKYQYDLLRGGSVLNKLKKQTALNKKHTMSYVDVYRKTRQTQRKIKDINKWFKEFSIDINKEGSVLKARYTDSIDKYNKNKTSN